MPCGTAHHIRPGTGEVLARAGVVDAAVAGRREQHSIRRTCSGMSKWVPCSSAIALSASACIQSRNASLPWMLPGRVGVERGRPRRRRCAPGRRSAAATARISLSAGPAPRSPRRTSRRGRPWRRGSTARPARSARGRRPASPGRAGPARRAGTRRTRRSPRSPRPRRVAARRASAPSASSRSARPWKKLSPAGSVQMSHCLATSTICGPGADVAGVGRLAAASACTARRARGNCGEPGGDVGRPPPRPRWASGRRPCARSCSALAMTLISLVDSPASYRASSRPSRSCMASLATCSRSVVRARSRRARRACGGSGRPAPRSPSGRQVVQLVVVAGDADEGGAGRVERRPLVDVAVGEVIDLSHAADPT